jgi:phosphatidylglycerol:prolipoprotein diacylglycerol transferase
VDFSFAFIHWNPDPSIFHLGSFTIRWYGLLFSLGFLIGYHIEERIFQIEKLPKKWLESLLLYVIFATIIGARLGHVFFYGWDYYSRHPKEIIMLWHGGLASHGGALAIVISLFIYSKKVSKKPVLWILDRVVIPTALAASFIRLGNLMNSEIYGIETNLPWGFIFERNGEVAAKHPTQIYESLAYLVAFALLMYMYWKTNAKNKPGLLTAVFLLMVFTARFFIEIIKENQAVFEESMLLNMGQLLSLPFIATSILLLYYALTRSSG